jgi:hypothetical protein
VCRDLHIDAVGSVGIMLERHREAIARFGQGMKPIEALARRLV